MPTWKRLTKIERIYSDKIRFIGKMRSIWTWRLKPIEYKWMFISKCNEKNEITRYKSWLITQGFIQRLIIDYKETYSPMMDITTFRYLVCMAMLKGLDMHLINVVTAYLYGSLNNNIYMRILEGFQMLKQLIWNINMCSIKL